MKSGKYKFAKFLLWTAPVYTVFLVSAFFFLGFLGVIGFSAPMVACAGLLVGAAFSFVERGAQDFVRFLKKAYKARKLLRKIDKASLDVDNFNRVGKARVVWSYDK